MKLLPILIFTLHITCVNAQQKRTSIINFDFDSSNLSVQAKDKLNQLIETTLSDSVEMIQVVGYTDFLGEKNYNQKLSLKRAESVVSILKSVLPSTTKFEIEGVGSSNFLTTEQQEQHLNRRVEITFVYHEQEKLLELEEVYEDAQEQRFTVDLDDTVVVKAIKGTSLKIIPQSLQTKDGIPVKGKAEVIIKEYYDPSTIILAGLHSNSDKGILQTGGMVNIVIVQNGDTLDSKTLKKIELKMPVINQALDSMNIFLMAANNDTQQWRNTGSAFTKLVNVWHFDKNSELADVHIFSEFDLTKMPVGRTYSSEYNVHNGIFLRSIKWPYYSKPNLTKRVKLIIHKLDSQTVQANAKIKYRARGQRITGKKRLDTTFNINYTPQIYVGLTGNLNWINCDRFLNYPNKSNFYVKTPGIKGLKLMLYFKEMNAFMPAFFKNNKYVMPNVPANMEVTVVAYGKKGEDYYFEKRETTTGKETVTLSNLSKISKDTFDEMFNNL